MIKTNNMRQGSFSTTLTTLANTVSPSGFGLSMVFGASMAIAQPAKAEVRSSFSTLRSELSRDFRAR